jgi:hypothetical protein
MLFYYMYNIVGIEENKHMICVPTYISRKNHKGFPIPVRGFIGSIIQLKEKYHENLIYFYWYHWKAKNCIHLF